MTAEEPLPAPDEIKDQLDRMLASKRFKAARNQADFFELVVKRALAGKKTTEDIIGRKLFGPKFNKDLSTDVRVTASYLRMKLIQYSENEGRDDPITILLPKPSADKRINLPAGEAYRPIFAYNPHGAIAREYRLGVYFLTPKTPLEVGSAMEQFKKVLVLNPRHIGAHIGMLEAMCLSAFTHTPAHTFLLAATEVATETVLLSPQLWHVQVAAGTVWFLLAEIKRASNHFEKALALNRSQTLQYGWYHAFLMATGHQSEALALAKARSHEKPDNATIRALYGAYLYLSREFETANTVLKNAIELDPNCWTAQLFLALVHLACGDGPDALYRLNVMDHTIQIAQDRSFQPGLKALARKMSDSKFRTSDLDWALKLISEDDPPCPVQAALYFMIADKPVAAIDQLKRAWREYEPVILFLHILPLFDSIRAEAGFRDLVYGCLVSRHPYPLGSQPE